MNRIFATLLMMLICSTVFADPVEIDGIYYNLHTATKEAAVTSSPQKYTGSVIIPESVSSEGEDYFVTSIDREAFYKCTGLTSVSIPETVTSIGSFKGCSALTYINIPNSVKGIESETFYECSSLESIIIPNSVKGIGMAAFAGCASLQSITIPRSVTSIGLEAFSDCSNLNSIIVDSDNEVYDSREDCNAIIETSSNTLIRGCQNTIIPNTVTSIGFAAFSSSIGLTSIDIPNSVISIGSFSFIRCKKLSSVNIPNSVSTIGDNAFALTSLVSVTIPNSLKEIGTGTFQQTPLLSILIPNSVKSIGTMAFHGCTQLSSIDIPNTITIIGNSAFSGCTGLTSVSLGNSLTSIGNNAFDNCSGIKAVISLNPTPPVGVNFDYDAWSKGALYVPVGSKEVYQNADGWRYFSNRIIEIGSLPGDVNGDGDVTAQDASLILQKVAGKTDW